MKKSVWVGSLLLMLSTGLGTKPIVAPAIAKQVVSQPPLKPAPTSQSKIELVTPGAQPRQALRFKPAVNTIETTTITLNTAMEMSIPGLPNGPRLTKLPSTLMKMETVVTQIDPNGDVHYKFRYTDADIKGDASIPVGLVNTARTQVKKMVGLSGFFVMDDRGNTKSTNLTIPKGVDATTRQMLEQSFQSLEQLSAPLPEAAIGVGAQWKMLVPVKIYGMMLNQTETYELVSLKDGVATLKVSVEQQAQSQKLTFPGMPKGATMTLKSLNTTGQGEIKVRLDRLLPPVARLSLTSAAQMQSAAPGTAEAMTIATKTQIEMLMQSK